MAAAKAKQFKHVTCFITFDQHLYWKASDITAALNTSSHLSNVIVRLSGFHLLMSFLSAVGYIIFCSGLGDILAMRKGTKSNLYASFTPLGPECVLSQNLAEVIDGGWLLHKVVLNKESTINIICDKYVV